MNSECSSPAQHALHDLPAIGAQHAPVVHRRRAAARRQRADHARRPRAETTNPCGAAARRRPRRSLRRACASSLGISSGGFCRSASSVTTTLPRETWKPGEDRAVLPGVVGELDEDQVGVVAAEILEHLARAVRRAVVDVDDLEGLRRGARAPHGAGGGAPAGSPLRYRRGRRRSPLLRGAADASTLRSRVVPSRQEIPP